MNRLLFLSVSFLLLVCSCSYQADQRLTVASSLIESHPDSALTLLESIPHPQQMSGASRAEYALLLTQARDKNAILHTSDSLIRIAVDYYKDGTDWMQGAKAYFYLGSVYRDMGEDIKAVDAFLKAKSTIPVQSKERLLLLTCTNLYRLYEKQNLYDEARTLCKESYRLSINRGDSTEFIYALNDLARVFLYFDQPDSAIYYLDGALKISKLMSDKESRPFIYSNLAHAYEQKEQYHIANEYITEALKNSSGKKIHPMNVSKGDILTKLGALDSARHYLLKDIEEQNSIRSKASTYSSLYDLEKRAGRYKEATRYIDSFIKLNGSIELQKGQNEIVQLINSQKHKLHEKDLLIKEEQHKKNLIVFFIALLATITFGFRLIIRQRRNRIKELNEVLKSNRIAMLRISQQLEEGGNVQDKEEGINRLKIICFQNLNSSIQLFMKTSIYKRIQEINQKKTVEMLPSKEREIIVNSICDNFPEVISNLCDLYGLNIDDTYYCILLSMRFSNATIAVCMGVSEGACRSRKTRIKTKMGEEDYLRLSDVCL